MLVGFLILTLISVRQSVALYFYWNYFYSKKDGIKHILYMIHHIMKIHGNVFEFPGSPIETTHDCWFIGIPSTVRDLGF